MSEQLQIYTEAEAQDYTRIFRAVGQKGLREIDSIYGTGFDDKKLYQADNRTIEALVFPWNSNLFHNLYLFHNGRHGRNTGDGTRRDMQYVGLPEPYVSLAEAIARIHDRIRTSGIVHNEEQSAEWFNNSLEEQLEREKVRISRELLEHFKSISNEGNKATIPTLDGPQLIGQYATEQEYTSDFSKLIAYDISSRDLGEVFLPTGPLVSHLWSYELHDGEPTIEQMIAFETSQVAMDTGYQHPLALWDKDDGRPVRITDQYIQQQFTPYRNAVIEHSTQVLEGLQTGRLRNHGDVIHYDVKFALDCHRGIILPDHQR